MRVGRIHLAALLLLVGLSVVLAAAVAWGRAQVVGQPVFQSNGDSISGWRWLRSGGDTATWKFDVHRLQGAKATSVYLNFAPLVTNGVNGGAGYSTTCSVTVQGNKTAKYTIALHNPYKPKDPENSGGIGYQCYGSTSAYIPSTMWKNCSILTVTISYPFTGGYHVAVNRNCVSIGFSK